MKKLFLMAALVAALSACSTATLININVDGDSFIPANLRSPPPLVISAGPTVTNYAIPDGGLALPLPSLAFLTKIALKLNVGVVSSVAGAINGTLQLFVAPVNSGNLYDVANKVPTSTTCTTDATVNGTNPVEIGLNLAANSPAPCATAFNRIKSGQFKIGARVSFAVTADTSVTITLNNFDVGVSGYPIQILQ
jgi:hypothetical protein